MWNDADDLEDYEYPDPPDEQDESDLDCYRCEICGENVYEDAVCCPSCGHYLSDSQSTRLAPHWRWVAIGLLVLFAVSLWMGIF